MLQAKIDLKPKVKEPAPCRSPGILARITSWRSRSTSRQYSTDEMSGTPPGILARITSWRRRSTSRQYSTDEMSGTPPGILARITSWRRATSRQYTTDEESRPPRLGRATGCSRVERTDSTQSQPVEVSNGESTNGGHKAVGRVTSAPPAVSAETYRNRPSQSRRY